MNIRDATPAVLGQTVYDSSHNKLGKIGHVFVDDTTGQPEWMTVQTGLFGTKESLFPWGPQNCGMTRSWCRSRRRRSRTRQTLIRRRRFPL